MRKIPKPSAVEKRIFLIVQLGLSVVLWNSYFSGSAATISALGRASQSDASFSVVAASTFILHLCFLAGFVYVYELYGKYEKAYSGIVGSFVLLCGASYILSGTILGIGDLALYEPVFITFLFLNSLAFHFGIVPREDGAIET